MTYETDDGGPLGYRWRLRDGIAKHVTASLETVTVAGANREARLRDYRDFFESTFKQLKRKFYLVPGTDLEDAAELVSLLMMQGIEVLEPTMTFDCSRLRILGLTHDPEPVLKALSNELDQTYRTRRRALAE